MLDALLSGASQALSWQGLLASVLGVVIGLAASALPGVTVSLGMILVLPLSFVLPPAVTWSMFLGLYAAGMTGGSFTAILLNIPGTPSASATGIDGYKMAQRGEAGAALAVSIWGSFLGGIISWLCLVLIAPPLARVALSFGAPELFAIILFGLTIISTFSQRSMLKGILAGILGLLVTTIGMDPITGTTRFTFDYVSLQGGVSFLPAMVGLFALPQILSGLSTRAQGFALPPTARPKMFGTLRLMRGWEMIKALLVSSGIGTTIGIIPGVGAPVAVFVAYEYVKRLSRRAKRFGTGIPEGVVAPEAANNAVSGGAMVPMLTLGIPGDTVTAVLLGAFLIQGIQPGPTLFQNHPDLVYAIFVGLLVANVISMILSFWSLPIMLWASRVRPQTLWPLVAVMCIVGSYSLRNSVFDAWVMLVFGIIGTLMNRFGLPVVPMVLGLVLGADLEEYFRMSLLIGRGDATVFFTRPVSLGFILISIGLVVWPLLRLVLRQRRRRLAS
ncbi:MAG: C4-dicarboxylate ABC transporter permease [Chloroflexota bacterium]|nr:MAG: C4-dicarboxylate ABC transporter permease [Chloroflexota bacterium]